MKYIVELKESPARKLLRYALWAILLIGVAAILFHSVALISKSLAEGNIKSFTGALVDVSPEKAISIAGKLYRAQKNEKSRLYLIKVLIEAKEWKLADALLDGIREYRHPQASCYDAIVNKHLYGYGYAYEMPKVLPATDEIRLLWAKTAVETEDKSISDYARQALRGLELEENRTEAALLLAQMDLNAGDNGQARELAVGLMPRKLSASTSIRLLKILEALKAVEADDYRSTLKVAARSNYSLSIVLARYLATTQDPQKVADWIKSLPTEIREQPELKLKTAELLYKAGKADEAAAAIEKVGSPTLDAALKALVKSQPVAIANFDSKELSTLGRFLVTLSFPEQELVVLTSLNKLNPSLWSLQAAINAAEHTHHTKAIIDAYAALERAIEGSLVLKAKAAYWKLLANTESAKESYEILKAAQERYPNRTEYKTSMALAHYRLENLTDALLSLPKNPQGTRENLIAAFLFTKAGQNEKAGTFLKNVPASELTVEETEFYNTTLTQLRSNAPLQRVLELLKQN